MKMVRSVAARALVVLGLLMGVFVLQGLTAEHDVMISADVDTARTALAVASQEALHDSAVVGDLAADRALVEVPLAPDDDQLTVATDAFLTALLLLLGLAVLRIAARPADDETAGSPLSELGALMLSRPPDLAKLCILRT